MYEYLPAMYDCEVLVIDDDWSSVGSTKIGNRSLQRNDGAGLIALDAEFASRQA